MKYPATELYVQVVLTGFKLVPILLLWLLPDSFWLQRAPELIGVVRQKLTNAELIKRATVKRQYLLRGVLESLTVEDILNPLAIIEVSTDNTINEAWQKMLDNNVNCAPVWDPLTGTYLGFLELQDSVSYVVRLAEAEHRSRGQCLKTLANAAMEDFNSSPGMSPGGDLGSYPDLGDSPDMPARMGPRRISKDQLDLHLGSLRDTVVSNMSPAIFNSLRSAPAESGLSTRGSAHELHKFCPRSNSTIEFFAQMHKFDPVQTGDCLKEVARRLQLERRVPVVNKKGQLVSVITQSRLAQFLNVEQHFWEWQLGHKVLSGTVEQFGFTRRPLLKVCSQTHSALHVFTIMREKHIFSLPVVDEQGKLIACAQGRDLVGFLKDPSKFSLSAPILDFLQLSHENHRDRLAAITFEDEFTEVWDLMAEHGTCTVYIVDEDHKPVGSISLDEAVQTLVSTEEGECEVPQDIDVAFHNDEIEQKAIQLCSIEMDRWPLNNKPPDFHEDELLTKGHMKYIWAHLPRKAVHHDWRLLFSLEQHGASLKSLYGRCSMVPACIHILADGSTATHTCSLLITSSSQSQLHALSHCWSRHPLSTVHSFIAASLNSIILECMLHDSTVIPSLVQLFTHFQCFNEECHSSNCYLCAASMMAWSKKLQVGYQVLTRVLQVGYRVLT